MDRHKIRAISSWLIIGTIVVWIAWDIPAALIAGTYGTESDVVRSWATKYPSFSFSVGVLAGHWFWNAKEVRRLWTMYLAFAIIAGLLVADIVFNALPSLHPLGPFIVGMVTGRVLWPMAFSVD